MGIIYLLLPISLLFALCALAAYIWSVRSGQLDDLETPAVRAVFDEHDPEERRLGEKNQT